MSNTWPPFCLSLVALGFLLSGWWAVALVVSAIALLMAVA